MVGDRMSSQLTTKAERRRLLALWLGSGLYFLILLSNLHYVGRLPPQILVLGLIFNGAIFATFLFAIRQTYKRIQNQSETGVLDAPTAPRTVVEQQKIRRLWFAAGLYFILMLVAIQYAAKAPYQLLVVGSILNMAIILTFVMSLRHAYLGEKKSGMRVERR